MSVQTIDTKINALATAIATKIKAMQTTINSLSGGGSSPAKQGNWKSILNVSASTAWNNQPTVNSTYVYTPSEVYTNFNSLCVGYADSSVCRLASSDFLSAFKGKTFKANESWSFVFNANGTVTAKKANQSNSSTALKLWGIK